MTTEAKRAYMKEYVSRPGVKERLLAQSRKRSREWSREQRADPAKRAAWNAAKRQRKHDLIRTPEAWAKRLWRLAKSRAKDKNLPFELDVEDIVIPPVCPVLGVPIELMMKNSHAPSLDRVVPSLGYVRTNVKVISLRANKLKNNMSADEIRALLTYVGG